jgi:2,3-dihydro-2,3-dihydroxybenzoate dehydrogenase
VSGEFRGKVALVTGASQGIGRAVARSLARAGAHVIATDIALQGVRTLAHELAQEGLGCEARALDVGDPDAVEGLVAAVESERAIDAVACVAGVLEPGPVLALTDAAWRRTFRVNTDGVFHVARSVGRRMYARSRGAIAIVGSNAGRVPRVEMAAYAASKAATAMFAKCLGLELASRGVRCNVIAPGSTDTPMQRALWRDEQAPARVIAGSLETYRSGIPLQRIAEPDDVVEAVLFLLSDRARQITMHELVVDGGATLGV